MSRFEEILRYFPYEISNEILKVIKEKPIIGEQLQEIRIRVNRPIILKMRNYDYILECRVSNGMILQMLERFCENSIYAYKKQLCQGFITIKGGHRIGITGTGVIENNKIINLKYISSLNIRIAREVINCSKSIIQQIIDLNNQTIFNTLIVSPPGKGKTTLLRDIVRQISNGIPSVNFKGLTIGLIDERGEIAASYKGVPQNDVGIRTDVIENIEKQDAMQMIIRSMAPEVIACDEIGSVEDIQAIKKIMISGVKGIFTMHGNNIDDVKNNKLINLLVENKKIEKIFFI